MLHFKTLPLPLAFPTRSAARWAGQHQKRYRGDTCFAYSGSGTAPELGQTPTSLRVQRS